MKPETLKILYPSLRYPGRVAGATKVKAHDRTFDSKIELYMFDKLTNLRVKGDELSFHHQYVFEFIKGFRSALDGKWVRPITWKADFYIPLINTVIDPKGYPTEIAKLKIKLFKNAVHEGRWDIKHLYIPSNRSECDEVALMVLADVYSLSK